MHQLIDTHAHLEEIKNLQNSDSVVGTTFGGSNCLLNRRRLKILERL